MYWSNWETRNRSSDSSFAARLLNVHRDTVSAYIKKFNRGGMEALLHRDSSPDKPLSVVTRSGSRSETDD
ncbi:helix-turn-helix domain-containing protein [Bacillus wudalianchiensis]|uniref:helix-turn-helix domain-containing protein n=1 Tax=Pseudobacillus wudalianchiensis TaxID=1743143 RepID=UPI00159F2E48